MAFFNVRDFGAAGNGVADDTAAFQTAADTLSSLRTPLTGGGGVLFIPTGLYLLSRPLVIRHSTIVQGSGIDATRLFFSQPAVPRNETLQGVVFEKGSGASIRDIGIMTGKSFNARVTNPLLPPPVPDDFVFGEDGTNRSGLILRAPTSVRDCFISGFQHDGVYIHSNTGGPDGWQLNNCLIEGNGRHGIFVFGSAGGGCAMRCETEGNRAYGFFDIGHTGNNYIACISQNDGTANGTGGGYHIGSVAAARNVLLGCIEDGSDGTAGDHLEWPTISIGGLIGRSGLTLVGNPTIISSQGDITADGIRSSGVRHLPQNGVETESQLIPNDTMILVNTDISPPAITETKVILPDSIPETMDGYQVTIKKVKGSRPVVIQPPSTNLTIDGAPSLRIDGQNSWVTLLGSQGYWYVTGRGNGGDGNI